MPSDREPTAVVDTPEILADEMADATKRLRERAWMISPHTIAAGAPDPLTFPLRLPGRAGAVVRSA